MHWFCPTCPARWVHCRSIQRSPGRWRPTCCFGSVTVCVKGSDTGVPAPRLQSQREAMDGSGEDSRKSTSGAVWPVPLLKETQCPSLLMVSQKPLRRRRWLLWWRSCYVTETVGSSSSGTRAVRSESRIKGLCPLIRAVQTWMKYRTT